MSSYAVVLKTAEPGEVASLRRVVPDYPAVAMLIDELTTVLSEHQVQGLVGAIWHDAGYKERDIDAEALVFPGAPVPAPIAPHVRTLPGCLLACTTHRGAYNRLPAAYQALNEWIAANGFAPAGPVRELYWHRFTPVRQDDETCVTEIQFPVQRVFVK